MICLLIHLIILSSIHLLTHVFYDNSLKHAFVYLCILRYFSQAFICLLLYSFGHSLKYSFVCSCTSLTILSNIHLVIHLFCFHLSQAFICLLMYSFHHSFKHFFIYSYNLLIILSSIYLFTHVLFYHWFVHMYFVPQELNIWREYEVDAYVIVYSITDRRSYQKAVDLMFEMRKVCEIATAIILVANKADLVRSRTVDEEGNSFSFLHWFDADNDNDHHVYQCQCVKGFNVWDAKNLWNLNSYYHPSGQEGAFRHVITVKE